MMRDAGICKFVCMCRSCNLLFTLLIFLIGCAEDPTNGGKEPEKTEISSTDSVRVDTSQKVEQEPPISEREAMFLQKGLIDVQEVIPEVLVDLKYSSDDNFMGFDLYGDLHRCYLQPDVAQMLKKAHESLVKQDSTLTFLIYDGVRPRSIQQMMWDSLDMPFERKIRFVSNPQFGSLHNFGAAVDITLARDSEALDMGAGYDDTSLVAWPIHEQQMLEAGLLDQQQLTNRYVLRRAMSAGGFFNIQSEWWHFNACYREEAQRRYEIIE